MVKKSQQQGINRLVKTIKNYPSVNHLLRAIVRFNQRMGSQFGAAITYFSFLSMIPLLMLSFAAAGFVLASRPDLLQLIIDGIIHVISEPTLAAMLERTVNTAVQQRTVVGISGLLLALYSGVNWMRNLRQAIAAQTHEHWLLPHQGREGIIKSYLKDLLHLVGLGVALVLTIFLTSVMGSAQNWLIKLLGLADIAWLRTPLTLLTLIISVMTNYLMFLWIYRVLPPHPPKRSAWLKGALLAAIGFEILKFAMTMLVPVLVRSPSGAAFGSIIGLLAFFYFFAQLTLFCAAWIGTARDET